MKNPQAGSAKLANATTAGSAIRNGNDPQSDERLLEKRARALAKVTTKDQEESETLSLMTFPMGEERYAVEIGMVKEIQPLVDRAWSRVPSTPDFIVGAVNIRGRIYSVMDVARFLGLPPRPVTEKTHVLLVQGGGEETDNDMEVCILADDLPEVANIPIAEMQTRETVSDQTQEYVRGVTADMLVILDLGRLLRYPGIVVNEKL
ncbi:MAG: chemotaxis protein CheW [Desulfobacteraceae bacterium]|uniref:Chemotaxis protein CheW n=1 Tax=Candidatus Desulfacyla euxinica TaxID=2841693 RepID=A0A8J6N3T8_9DELT|nr:chemotaxis protein CheW [Candidatus Desulfacyla euxinica]MBL6977621.1 chemotaxis protein CheW [Desulfobacteraceae bacterium]MBL7216208.1 chemotaxis protein CheW [Desulfobacteraceae bacterium]